MHSHSLSVIVPTRNARPWVGELLDSLLAQDAEDVEIIVVDNGSTDGTAAFVEEAAACDPRVRLITSEATSAAAARNEGVDAATGEYLVFADSDDIVPDGAYRTMLDSLEASGSDIVIGDHLKFSVDRTWSPTRRWHPFDAARVGVAPTEVPELLSGRPCWNRMFRRSFWDQAGLRFPEVPSVEDIEPMTRAFVAARSIDVVPDCVYLYRDRGDATSLSVRADADVTRRYLEQELACAALVRHDPVLRSQHAEIVLDADGWAHLQRFLLSAPSDETMSDIAESTAALLDAIPHDGLGRVGPVRRVLWLLVRLGDWAAARSFVSGTASASEADRLAAWIDAVAVILPVDGSAAGSLAVDGLVPAFVNGADRLPAKWFAQRLGAIDGVDLLDTGSVLADAMIAAVRAGDSVAIPKVSAVREVVPLVVDRVNASDRGLLVGGPADLDALGIGAEVVLTGSTRQHTRVATDPGIGGWRSELIADPLTPGRYVATVAFAGISGDFPVVTARMPLPPVDDGMPMQPLADRKDGWRFLVDRRPPRGRGIGGLVAKVRRKLR